MSMVPTSVPERPGLLLVDDDPLITETLEFLLGREFQVTTAASRGEARQAVSAMVRPPGLALVDLGLPPLPHGPEEGLALISDLLGLSPEMKILVLSGQSARDNARRALSLGAVEFVVKPCEPEELRRLLRSALAIREAEAQAPEVADGMVGTGEAVLRLRLQIRQYAASPFPLLIEGESGSGKELVASSLHRQGPRAAGPYLPVNCAAIAPTLVEVALFGVARGAFTGAVASRQGYFGEACGGTLFLDEIGELAPEIQVKLLRVLEDGSYQRVGETQARTTDARVIAATNRDLRQAIRTRDFRADLYHRLSVFSITVPPLRERGADKLRLAAHFIAFYCRQCAAEPISLAPEAQALWLDYPFPGNVRELRNIIIRLTTKYPGAVIGRERLSLELDPDSLAAPRAGPGPQAIPAELAAGGFSLDAALSRLERSYVEAALELSGGNLSQAARLLGLQRTTLYSRLQHLRRPDNGDGGETPG